MKTKRTGIMFCIGCKQRASFICTNPQCHRPTCRKAVGLCGHIEGICAVCVGVRLMAAGRANGVPTEGEGDGEV